MRSTLLVIAVFLAFAAAAAAQTTSGSITGSVVDQQGAPVAGALVSIKNMDTNAVFTAKTRIGGDFIVTDLQAAPYTVTVEQSGFKKIEQSNVVLTANTNISIGQVQLQVGAIQQTVEVVAQGAQLEATSSDQSTGIVGTQIENTEVNGRSVLALLSLVPGMYTDGDFSVVNNQTGNIYTNGTRGTSFNLTMNGASNIDTGSNSKMMATVSLDAIQEVHVMTANFDAQYGKNAGGQIMVITKSGSTTFHGAGFWYYRDRGLNANTWMNDRDGVRKPYYHYNYEGYNLGGPAYIPGKFNRAKDKLFFFWSEEYQQQLIPQSSAVHVTVPTALERQGNFSQTLTNNNTTTPYSPKDYTTGAPFPGGIIPASKLYAPGLAVLNLYPLPNVSGQTGYNYQSQVSSSEPRHEQLLRLDYNATEKWRFSGSWTNLAKDVLTGDYCPSGYSLCPNFPLTPIQYKHPGYIAVLNATRTISPTLVNETIFDIAHHPVTVLPTDPNALTATATGVNLPTLYPAYDNWIPRISFNGSRISNAPSFDTGGGEWSPFNTYNSTIEWIDNLSKVFNTHVVKAGVFIHRNRKDQSAYAKTEGHYDWGDNSANPYDTGFGFANAAIGTYYSFADASKYVTGQYRYTNAEFYLQDSWKALPRLTLNYGIRAYYIQPYYDKGENTSNFLPNDYDASQAVRLYYPAIVNGTKVGLDRATGQTVSSFLVGQIVPGSGNMADGLLQAGHGISPYLMKSPGLLWAPRVGLAWDVTGKQNLVFRAGGGVYYDRYQGNDIFNMITNPPSIVQPTIYNGFAQNIGQSGAQYFGPPGISAIDYNGNVPTVINFSAGIQTKLPKAVRLDLNYVGSISRHLMEVTNINGIPYGADFLPQNQDPTLTATSSTILGSNALSSNFLRPYQGYGAINLEGFGATGNYNSLQAKLDRHFASGLFVSSAFTWSKCLGTAFGDGDSFRIDNLSRYALYSPCSYNIPFNLVVNYVYPLPGASHWGALNNVVTRAVSDGWQIAGLSQFRNGTPYSVGFSVPSYGNNQLTGSQDFGARVWLVGDPLAGISGSDPYSRINAAAFRPPMVGSIGIESPKNYLVGPGVNDWDMALQRQFKLKERLKLNFRADAFNIFNHAQFNGINSTINFTSITNPTPTNLPYRSDGTFNVSNKNGFGTVSGVRSPRVMQLMVKVTF